jgi:PIN domain nuclease of toxin-antitoxin system
VRALVDTHTLIWWALESPELSATAAATLREAEQLYLSLASCWEIVIKVQINKIRLLESVDAFFRSCVEEKGIELLPINLRHLATLSRLPLWHKDPFDRLLVAQAQVEGLSIITGDAEIGRYGVDVIW